MFSTDMSIDRIRNMEPAERQEFVEWLISNEEKEIERLFHGLYINQYMKKSMRDSINTGFIGQPTNPTAFTTTNPLSTYTTWTSTNTSTHYDHVHGPSF